VFACERDFMKRMIRFCSVVSVGISLLVASKAFADGRYGGGHGGGGYGGYHGGGYRGGWGGPVVAIGFGGPYYYGDYPATYYYAPAPVVYTQPQVVYTQSADSNSQATPPTSAPAPNIQNQPVQTSPQKSSLTVADIKALAKGGLSDEVILSQIRSSQAVFNTLSTEEIIDLNTSKVSQKVIDFMINTGNLRRD